MTFTTALAAFFLIWWVTLFAVLPWGVRSQHEGGEMARTFTSGIKKQTDSSNTWTKGLVLSKEGQTASAYTIKTLGGKNYLFYEWKSGDYVFGHMQPRYYVLTQAGGEN